MRDYSPEAFERLREYVKRRLLESGVIPEHQANPVNPYSLAAHIVGRAWRQCDVYYYADMDIEEAIRYPPEPTDSKHFSLKDYVKTRQSLFGVKNWSVFEMAN